MSGIVSRSIYKAAAVQAAPIYLDIDATVEKTVTLVARASSEGAAIVAFPECWLPGYPWWIWLDTPADGMALFKRYADNSLVMGSAHLTRICEAARKHAIMVVLGSSERAGGSLYIAQTIIGADGVIVAHRRKLKPTHVERTVFGDGHGNDLAVHDTPLGRVGALACWEHLQPLTRYAMYSMNEQVHVASWPSFSLYPGIAYALGAELNMAASQMYAAEGQCFVLAPTAVVSPEMRELLCDTDKKRGLLGLGGGSAMIFGPDGRPLCTPIPHDQEGMQVTEIDMGHITIAKSVADPVGHYARPDVTRLLLNRSPAPVVTCFSPDWQQVEPSTARE